MAAERSATYSIKFDFQAEEPTELPVKARELVRAVEGAHLSSEPWTLVETVAPPFNRGFVPTSFLTPVGASPPNRTPGAPAAAAAAAGMGAASAAKGASPPPPPPPPLMAGSTPPPPPPPPPPSSTAASTQGGSATKPADPMLAAYATSVAAVGPVRRLSDPRLPHHLLDALSINPPEEHDPTPLPLPLATMAARGGPGGAGPRDAAVEGYELSLRPFQTEHATVFAQHDRSFQQIMHQRHEQFRSIEDAAADVSRRLESTRTKAAELAAAMSEVNEVIEQERRRWKELQASQSFVA